MREPLAERLTLLPPVTVPLPPLLTVRSAPPQTFTLLLALPVVAVSLVVNFAVLSVVAHVPEGAVTVFEYVKDFGLASADVTVPSEPPPNGSSTVTLSSASVIVA